ncbi:hypothetical protein L3X38_022827 [Prunus dulcis]|uniref:At2g35280-like TPR domain-containing protein n=1 Tax=Prunus dulcis TaxID=3755 RepID=A0AAD4VXU6_PRUDU|nr:hypothetical protein L3X38_036147 [Prunus dulcis]KAI5326716.1 hypothetical protein L3X38_035790 [Prunus dulcis]KAI5332698.1 hypothetical protein L3X38_022827 [Prunus dulcis]
MNSKHFTTIGGKRRKHVHLEMPQAFIPESAWFQVMLYVATESSEDLFRMASVCPLFQNLANSPQVWNTISMAKYPYHPIWYRARPAVQHFLEQCRACDNPESIFREAFDIFFKDGKVEALYGMRTAATAGHMEAAYVVGLLGMSGIGQSKEDALQFLCSLNQRNNIDMKGTRDALTRRLDTACVATHIVDMFDYGKIKFNRCSACNNNEWYFVIQGWPSEDKINPAFWTCCNRCKWHRESIFWSKLMREYVVRGNHVFLH